MPRALFAICLSLGYMAAALSPLGRFKEKDIIRLEASMSVDDALNHLRGKLNSEILDLVQVRRGESNTHKIKVLMEMAGNGTRRETMNKKGVEDARLKLNHMIEEEQENLDKLDVDCEANIKNENHLLEAVEDDVKLLNAQNTQTESWCVDARGNIAAYAESIEKFTDEKNTLDYECATELSEMKERLWNLTNDSVIIERILGMIDCPGASFIQCNETQQNTTIASFENPAVHAEMSKLQSDKVKGLVKDAVLLGYKSNGATVTTAKGSKVSEIPGDETMVPDDMEQPCSLATNPNCGKLQDRFIEIDGEVKTDIEVTKKHIADREDECEEESNTLESQLVIVKGRHAKWTGDLAKSEEDSQARKAEIEKAEAREIEQTKTYLDVVSECSTDIANKESEICALKKIRGELYKMSSVTKALGDCEVSEWIYGECSKHCMQADETTWGVQLLERTVTTWPNDGAGCPPLAAKQDCGKFPCAIDCDQDQWSDWSSCTAKCGGGIRERMRSTTVQGRYGGKPCGIPSETETCNSLACDKNCQLGAWSKLSEAKCSRACGGGNKRVFRKVLKQAIGMGTCPAFASTDRMKTVKCNRQKCTYRDGKTLVCDSSRNPQDVTILLDGSGSLGPNGWKVVKSIGQTIVNAFDEGLRTWTDTQVAVQVFSGPRTWLNFFRCIGAIRGRDRSRISRRYWWAVKNRKGLLPKFNQSTDCGISWATPFTESGHFTKNFKDTEKRIRNLAWPRAATFTTLALAETDQEEKYGREGVQKLVFVVTDGRPFDREKTAGMTQKLIREGVRVMWLNIGPWAKDLDLSQWASWPLEDNVFQAFEGVNYFYNRKTGFVKWKEIYEVVNSMVERACEYSREFLNA